MVAKRKTRSGLKSSSRAPAGASRGPKKAVPTSVLKVSGTSRPPIALKTGPAALSVAEKTNLLKSIGLPGPGTIYVTLSPSRTVSANRAALVFERATIVDGGWGYATWVVLDPEGSPTADERLGVWFNSEGANRRYLIDWTVNGGAATGWGTSEAIQSFKVVRPNASLVIEASVPRAGGHVTCVVETQDANWYGFMLLSGNSWTFWSCEITRL